MRVIRRKELILSLVYLKDYKTFDAHDYLLRITNPNPIVVTSCCKV